jgi:hypothetical protein
MSVAALVFLGIAAIVPPALSLPKLPQWLAPAVAITALAAAAVFAAAGQPVKGFGVAATAVLAVAAAATGGISIPPLAFRIARRQGTAGSTSGPVGSGPLRGGLIIGILERAAVAAAILAAKGPEGIAIVMAVKGLARYPELREPTASEQFIIGTFASVLWACAAAGVGRGMFS